MSNNARVFSLLLACLGFAAGCAHALPEECYLFGYIGPFDILLAVVVLTSVRYIGTASRSAKKSYQLFALFAVLSYIGELIGVFAYGDAAFSKIFAPLRFIIYPLLFVCVSPRITNIAAIRLIFGGWLCGILLVALLAYRNSPDPTFFNGLPVMWNPNVIGNFIAYAALMVATPLCFRAQSIRAICLLILVALSFFTFSKASYFMVGCAVLVNMLQWVSARGKLLVLAGVFIALCVVAEVHYGKDLEEAISIKMDAAVGKSDVSGVGSFQNRLGFFVTSVAGACKYPLGVGLANYVEVNDEFSYIVGKWYTWSDSPHNAIGFSLVQAGWMGLAIMSIILVRAFRYVLSFLPKRSRLCDVLVLTILITSTLFQIEIFTQPFIYIVMCVAYSPWYAKHAAEVKCASASKLGANARLSWPSR